MEFIKIVVCLLLVSSASELVAQRSGKVIDSTTNDPIPYVNIWIESTDEGTSSDINGSFLIEDLMPGQYLIFSAVGYDTKRIAASDLKSTISLNSIITNLDEVVITASKERQKVLIGNFKKSKINYFYSASSRPKICARYFGDIGRDHLNAQLKIVKIHTKATVSEARFQIRIYGVGADNQPGDLLHDDNIFGIAKKGNKVTVVDLSEYHIAIPETGIFIAVEWLVIDENIYYDKGRNVETREKVKYSAYDPLVGIVVSEVNPNSWIYENGMWSQVVKNPDYMGKKERGKYNMVAMELVLIE
mgnify:CR=1 FL=1